MPCHVEIASEYRYRKVVVPPGTLFVTLSQSGETADTLEALRIAKTAGYIGSLTVCNSPHSSMVRESDLVMMTQAGPEIGVVFADNATGLESEPGIEVVEPLSEYASGRLTLGTVLDWFPRGRDHETASRYSCRSASIGLIATARCDGIATATNDTSASTIGTAVSTSGSCRSTP